jgi:TolA-binding protein
MVCGGKVLRLFSAAAVTALTAAALSGCITPSEKRQLKNDLFAAQTRILTLEKQLADTSKEAKTSGASSVKKIASTQADMDKIARDIQLLRGELDAMRHAMRTGVVPGEEGNGEEGGMTLPKLAERVEAIEQAQEEMIEALNKAGVKKGSKKAARKASASLKDLGSAFKAKKYKDVVDDAPEVIKKESGDAKAEARYLWAEAYFKLGKMRDAALKFNDLADSKPPQSMLPAVKMRLGDCFRNLGDPATAKIYYEELVNDFPSTDEALKAKERIAELDAKENKQG